MSTANKFKYVENFETEIKWLKPLKKNRSEHYLASAKI